MGVIVGGAGHDWKVENIRMSRVPGWVTQDHKANAWPSQSMCFCHQEDCVPWMPVTYGLLLALNRPVFRLQPPSTQRDETRFGLVKAVVKILWATCVQRRPNIQITLNPECLTEISPPVQRFHSPQWWPDPSSPKMWKLCFAITKFSFVIFHFSLPKGKKNYL